LYFVETPWNLETVSGFMLDNILENPCPTLAMRSAGSLNGNLFHE